MQGLVALAGIAAVAEGFTVVNPTGWPLGSLSQSAYEAMTAIDNAVVTRRSAGRSSTTIMSLATETATTKGERRGERGFDIQSWRLGYQGADSEDQYLMEPSEGSIPEDIEGTFFRNGAAKFKVGEDQIKHPLDGDGMVMAISFSKEGAYYRNRFVKTKGYKKELQAGKILYRGMHNIPGGPLKNAFRIARKNVANTNVIFWAGNLLALWEGGLPHRLDPKSLDTFGETTLGETIDEKRPIFAAHPRVDPTGNRIVGFGADMQDTRVYEYNKNFKLVQLRVLKEVAGFLHDFVVTDNYYVFFTPPLGIDPIKWVLGFETLSNSLKWQGDSKPAKITIVPRDSSKEIKSIEVPPQFCLHFANGFEDPKTGEVVVDMAVSDFLKLGSEETDETEWDKIDEQGWKELPRTKLRRYRLDVSPSGKGALVDSTVLYGKYNDFPTINPKVSGLEHRYVWGLRGGLESDDACPGQGLVKVDTADGTCTSWLPEPHEFLGEPTFIPRKGAAPDAPEDFGYIAHTLVNGRDKKTEVVILDAADVAKGPICRLPLKGFVPHSSHGNFAEDLVLIPEQIEKSFSLTDLFNKKGWNVAKSEFSGLGLNSVMD